MVGAPSGTATNAMLQNTGVVYSCPVMPGNCVGVTGTGTGDDRRLFDIEGELAHKHTYTLAQTHARTHTYMHVHKHTRTQTHTHMRDAAVCEAVTYGTKHIPLAFNLAKISVIKISTRGMHEA